jgi:hypothetical protein
MVSEPKTIEMRCFPGAELDFESANGVFTQNPETRGKTASRYKGSHGEAGIEAWRKATFTGLLQTLWRSLKQKAESFRHRRIDSHVGGVARGALMSRRTTHLRAPTLFVASLRSAAKA